MKCHRDKCTLPMMLGYQPRQSLEEEFDQTHTVHCSTQRESARPHRPRGKWTCCETGRKRTPRIRLKKMKTNTQDKISTGFQRGSTNKFQVVVVIFTSTQSNFRSTLNSAIL